MDLSRFLNRAGETMAERVLAVLSLLAATVFMVCVVLHLDPRLYKIAWAVGFVSVVAWNILVLLRNRRTGSPNN